MENEEGEWRMRRVSGERRGWVDNEEGEWRRRRVSGE